MNTKTVILFSSPNGDGFTAHALASALSQASIPDSDVTLLNCYELRVSPCIACAACNEGLCPHNANDAMGLILSELSQADIVILATPIYFFGFPAPMKTVIDRMQQFFAVPTNTEKLFKKSASGFLLLTSGSANNTYNSNIDITAKFFFKFINATFVDKLLIDSTDKFNRQTTDFDELTKAFANKIKERI